mgnify:CR=1 FL=1
MRESRGPLHLREYGRNLQNIVSHINSLNDKEERTRLATLAVELMKQINPNMTDSQDNNQVVWDHLHMISDYSLDVESPFPTPVKAEIQAKPKRLRYGHQRIKYKHYGKNMENLIDECMEIKEEEKRKEAEFYIARLMKSFYVSWNKENVDDEVIIKHLEELSNFQIKLDIEEVREKKILEVYTKPPTKRNSNQHRNNNNNKRKGGGSRRRRPN